MSLVDKNVEVDIQEVIDRDLDGFMDLLSERAVGYEAFVYHLNYTLIGREGDVLSFRVRGELDEEDE